MADVTVIGTGKMGQAIAGVLTKGGASVTLVGHGDDDAAVDDWVRIDHRGRAESLNVAMAATVLAFAAAGAREPR